MTEAEQLIDDMRLAWYQTRHTKGRMILVDHASWTLLSDLFMLHKTACENDLHGTLYDMVFRGVPVMRVNSDRIGKFKIVTEVVHR